jgi:hypothetical protein
MHSGMHTIHRVFPALVLFVVAPLFAELLFGSTTVTRLGALTVVVPMYGGAAVLIRELARRRRHPWLRIVLFGLAYGIVEEGLVFRSIFDPVLFGASAFGGRALGVNWVWACWVTGYHLVWSVVIPIAFIETIFRSREPWLRLPGVVLCAVLYSAGAAALSHYVRQNLSPTFQLSDSQLLWSAIASAMLVFAAFFLPLNPVRPQSYPPVPPIWVCAVTALTASLLWFALLRLPAALRTVPYFLFPLGIALGVAVVVALVIGRWLQSANWSRQHMLTLVFSGMVTSMAWGYFVTTVHNAVDHFAQGCMSLTAIAVFLLTIWLLRNHADATPATNLN